MESLISRLESIGEVLAKPSGYFSPVYQVFIKSPQWREKAKRITKTFWGNKPECDACGTKEGLQVHHKLYPPRNAKLIDFINQTEDRRNFAVLCGDCHCAVHKAMDKKKGVKRKRSVKSARVKRKKPV